MVCTNTAESVTIAVSPASLVRGCTSAIAVERQVRCIVGFAAIRVPAGESRSVQLMPPARLLRWQVLLAASSAAIVCVFTIPNDQALAALTCGNTLRTRSTAVVLGQS